MRKFILIVLVIIVIALAVFAGVVAMQPANFHIARSATIAAPPSDVFAQVNDFHKWEAWSPWLKADPAAKTTYEGPAAGTGAIFKWSGNSEVGKGAMTLTDSQPNELIKIKLDFEQPFQATNDVEFTFKPQGDATVVTWHMSGHRTFVTKAIGLVMNMDKMIGERFDEGLTNMKSVVEAKKEQGTEGKK